MKIGILAVQGAFAEHKKILESLGAECVEIRQLKDLDGIDGLVLPGGESTVQGQLLHKLGLFEPLANAISHGLPTLATCAGLILLAESIDNDHRRHLSTLPVKVKRNAYGRQLSSFKKNLQFGESIKDFPAVFIRAPYIEDFGRGVEILSQLDGKIVGVRYQKQIGLAFHPEMTEDRRIHEEFLKMVLD